MHERSIIRQLIVQVEKLMNDHQADCVSAIRISVGEFSGIESVLLNTAFIDEVTNTRLFETDLEIKTVPLEGKCKMCGKEFIVKKFRFKCPACDGRDITILRGENLMLESVVLEGV